MGYEIFERKTPRMGTPLLSFSKIGGITFNQTASRILQKASITNVLLMWDAKDKKLAMKTASTSNDIRSYVIRYNDKGNGAGFSAKTFLDYAGINYAQRKAIPISITPEKEFLIETPIPEACLKIQE